ncbi:MAG: RHS repeat-associated core domain-containing protein, partial [Myxococcota bacterium]
LVTADENAPEPSTPGALLWSSVRRLLVETGPADGATFLHHDHLRSITLATAEGEVVGRRSFYPMGQVRDTVGYVDTYGYTGQEHDATGLIHFDWRYYDPQIGRWLSIDPAFATAQTDALGKLGESTTAYAYVANNFANLIDPTGLETGKTKAKTPSGTGKSTSKPSSTKVVKKRPAVKASLKSGVELSTGSVSATHTSGNVTATAKLKGPALTVGTDGSVSGTTGSVSGSVSYSVPNKSNGTTSVSIDATVTADPKMRVSPVSVSGDSSLSRSDSSYGTMTVSGKLTVGVPGNGTEASAKVSRSCRNGCTTALTGFFDMFR